MRRSESQTPVIVIWNLWSCSYMEVLVKLNRYHKINGNSKGWIGSLRMDTARNACTCAGPLCSSGLVNNQIISFNVKMQFMSPSIWWALMTEPQSHSVRHLLRKRGALAEIQLCPSSVKMHRPMWCWEHTWLKGMQLFLSDFQTTAESPQNKNLMINTI